MELLSIAPQKSFFNPGEAARLVVEIAAREAASARLEVTVFHLAQVAAELRQELRLEPGVQQVEIEWLPPGLPGRGYGISALLRAESGAEMSRAAAAFDVQQHWTHHPRYGFLSEFSPGGENPEALMDALTRFHLNGLQFYDWMYRHEQLLIEQDPYLDLLGRQLSFASITERIEAAHRRNIAAMPYTAVYGASIDFYRQHPDWALLDKDGQPVLFGEDFMAIMDPRAGMPWIDHLLGEFERMLAGSGFDGVHLDQYGEPQSGYTPAGEAFDLAPRLAELINRTAALVERQRQDGAVIFNAVRNWPIQAVAPAWQNCVYIEVWPPYEEFRHLHELIVQAQELGEGKPVILAAYLDPGAQVNVRLVDAVIFASGGAHIELGELQDGAVRMLADPYFPRHKPLSPDLAVHLRRLYDFAVRYQEVIGPRTADATRRYAERAAASAGREAVEIYPAAGRRVIWPIVRESAGCTAVSLVNLSGIDCLEWQKPLASPPEPLAEIELRLFDLRQEARRVLFAAPDAGQADLRPLQFEQRQGTLTVYVPALEFWDLILILW